VKAKSPVNYFQLLRCSLRFTPMPRHVIQSIYEKQREKIVEWKNDDPAKQVVSGPYKLLYYDDTVVIYQRIDDWWSKNVFGLPKPRYIGYLLFKDNLTANAAFEREEVDWDGDFVPDIWKLFDKGRGTWFSDRPYFVGESTVVLAINNERDYLKNIDLRRAIAYAIPYTDMLEKGYFNYGAQASLSMINDLYPQFRQWVNTTLCIQCWGSADCRVKTDLNKAKEILDKAGIVDRDGDGWRELPDGRKLSFKIMVTYGFTDWMAMAEMIVNNLRKIGIDASTDFPEETVVSRRLLNGDYDMTFLGEGSPDFDYP
jgi:peptide/nickel transport system substrate-binding protein